uniref:Uncharacterized protein n=1 Tax=Morchella brunnea TaxID=1174671 RepID=A0A8K1I839_9PEZI|nr:hypothetical protein LK370_mgp232 [Morchella brunnea]UBU98424.1 hypothetical protein [Morchella brunnea]
MWREAFSFISDNYKELDTSFLTGLIDGEGSFKFSIVKCTAPSKVSKQVAYGPYGEWIRGGGEISIRPLLSNYYTCSSCVRRGGRFGLYISPDDAVVIPAYLVYLLYSVPSYLR